MDFAAEDQQWQNLDSSQRRQRTLDAIKHLFLRESQVQPLILVFEDLHWIDSETQSFLDGLIDSLPTASLILLVNYRPEYQHGWGSKTYYRQLRIDPLPPESAEELLLGVFGDDAALQPLKQLLIERTEGNPFFLEESVRTLGRNESSRRRARQVSSRRFARDHASASDGPCGVGRAHRPAFGRRETSASIGGSDRQGCAVRPAPSYRRHYRKKNCDAELGQLQAAEFLYETRLFPDLEYTFKHALTHEVAYGNVLQERRRALHASIAEAIERLYPDRLVEQVELLAHHAFHGELWEKAVTYLRKAGAKAADRSAHREAVSYFDRALEALKHLPESRQMIEQAIDIRIDLRSSLQPLGEQQKVFERLREAEALAASIDDQRRLGQISAYLSGYFVQAGEDPTQAIEKAELAFTIASSIGDFNLQVQANHFLGTSHRTIGDYDRAIYHFKKNIDSLVGDQIYDRFGLAFIASVGSHFQLVEILSDRGEFNEAAIHGDEAVRIAEVANHPFSLDTAYLAVGHLHFRKGDLNKAIALLERSMEICRVWDLPQNLLRVAVVLGNALAATGRVGEAMPLLELTNERARSSRIRVQLAQGYLLVGKLEEATSIANQVLESSQTQGYRGHTAVSLYVLAESLLHGDVSDMAKAEDHYDHAMALANELRMRPLVAHCHVGLGKLYRRTGDYEKAKTHLANGVAMMREMEMGLWLEKAEAELKELG